jgi:hypothetical protein
MSGREVQDPPVGLDLDTGELTDEWEKLEIVFTGSCGSSCFYSLAVNKLFSGARVMSLEQPSFEECVQSLFEDSEEYSTTISGPIGTYACLLTTENRIAIVRRENMGTFAEYEPWIEVSFLVFDEVFSD